LDSKTVLLLLLPVLSAMLGSYLTYYFAVKSRRDEAILRFKEEKYSALLVLLQGFIGLTTSSDLKRKFFEEQYRSWIYSSDSVVKAVNAMVQLVIDAHGNKPDPTASQHAIGAIVLAMRRDLLGHTHLSPMDFKYTDVLG